MSIEVEPSDWTRLDAWWAAYSGTQPTVHVFDTQRLADHWQELDPWWDTHIETGHDTAIKIANILTRSNEAWEQSDGPFDTDPLAADLTGKGGLRGPLQPGKEVEWSQWLAQLLRSSAALVSELFGVTAGNSPRRVSREERVSEEAGSYRRPDILVFHDDHGVSIEVKLYDENYRKTATAASLVEKQYDSRAWTHALLLPRAQKARLSAKLDAFGEPESDEPLEIQWDDPGPVSVIYWRDVAAALRSLLREGAAVDDHWAASAYLLCAVAEQQIMDFQPQPAIERFATSPDIVDRVQLMSLTGTLEEQLAYLESVAEQ